MQLAVAHVHYTGKKEVGPGDLLAAILEEEESHAAYFLRTEGLSRLDVLNYISHGISKVEQGETAPVGEEGPSRSAPAEVWKK